MPVTRIVSIPHVYHQSDGMAVTTAGVVISGVNNAEAYVVNGAPTSTPGITWMRAGQTLAGGVLLLGFYVGAVTAPFHAWLEFNAAGAVINSGDYAIPDGTSSVGFAPMVHNDEFIVSSLTTSPLGQITTYLLEEYIEEE